MFPRIFLLVALPSALLLTAPAVRAENSPPISQSWNISSSGKAATSGELLFRVTPGEGLDPVEVTVFVLSGTNETGVARSIRRALTTQLDAQRFDVDDGDGANVLLTGDGGGAAFSVELIDSDVEDVRVVVSSAVPVAPPTVPEQAQPANPPSSAAPQGPGNTAPGTASPPAEPGPATPSAPPTQPSAPPAQSSAPPAEPSAPPGAPANADGGAGAPASAPPPPPGNP